MYVDLPNGQLLLIRAVHISRNTSYESGEYQLLTQTGRVQNGVHVSGLFQRVKL